MGEALFFNSSILDSEYCISNGGETTLPENESRAYSVSVDDYFNKDYYPQIEVAKRMAKYFNCSLDYLFGLSDERNKIAYNDKPFFENLENLLKENKIPITRAMKEMGMSSYNYYRWRNGTYPTTLKLLEIVKYLEVSLDYLVGYSNKN